MNNDELKKSLLSLHASLNAPGDIDPELKKLLQTLDRDIHALLGKDVVGTPHAADLAERTQGYAAQFAAQHPDIESTLRELADILGKMGI